MALSFEHSIIPMSDVRANLEKVKKQLTRTPIIVTNNGRPDFGICDLDTLAIAVEIKDLKDLLRRRINQRQNAQPAETVFKELSDKYGI